VLLPYVNDAATGILAWLKDPETMKAIEDLKTFLGNMFESFKRAFDNPAVKDVFKRLQNGAKVFMDFLNSPQGAGIIQGFADLVAGAFTVVSEGIMIASFLAHGLISLLQGKFGEMDMTYQEYKDRYFPTEYVDKGSWTNGGYGSTRMADYKAAPIVVNFNAPVDSVSAGREVSKVLASYSKANGGMRWA
jgi:hypothetical protein